MKILIITSTICALIVIVSLIIVNVLVNTGQLVPKTLDTNTNTNINRNITNVNISDTNSEQTILQDTSYNCNSTHFVKKIKIMYNNESNVNKLIMSCKDNSNFTIEFNRNRQSEFVPRNTIELNETNGFDNVYIRKDNILKDFQVKKPKNNNNYTKYKCPINFKFSGLYITTMNDNEQFFKIICIKV